jgi:hypothetical protein
MSHHQVLAVTLASLKEQWKREINEGEVRGHFEKLGQLEKFDELAGRE